MAELVIGQVVDGRYELEAVIGKGGMGSVYRARHVITQGRVALKVMFDMDADTIARFLAEASAASKIGHPAIVAVSDAGRTADGQPFLVMELLAGKPLRIAMHGGLPGEQVRRIGLELLDVLGAAHARGIIHRDLKPENIFVLAGTGAIKVLDFGIAKVLGNAAITAHGFVLGTVEYMAPEQLTDASKVDGRADLWAVGVMLYEMIAGVRPYGGATREARYAALATEEPMPIEDVISVGPDVAQFFRSVLVRDPAQRFATAAAMAGALRQLSFTHTAPHAAQPGSSTMATGAGAQAYGTGMRPPVTAPTLATGGAPWQPHAVTGPQPGPSTGWHPPPQALPNAQQPPRGAAAAPSRSSTGKRVLLAIGLLVIAGGIAFGVVMGTRSKTIEVVAPDDAGVAKREDAAVVVATPDTPVVVVDAATVVASGSCEDHCKRLGDCGIRLSSCIDDCASTAHKICLEHAAGCEELAACHWKRECKRVLKPAGTKNCLSAPGCFQEYERQPFARTCDFCLDAMTADARLRQAKVLVCRENADVETTKALLENRPPNTNLSSRCDELAVECGKY